MERGKSWWKPKGDTYKGAPDRGRKKFKEDRLSQRGMPDMRVHSLSTPQDIAELNRYLYDIRRSVTNLQVDGDKILADTISSAQIASASIAGSCLAGPMIFGDSISAGKYVSAGSGVITLGDVSAAGDFLGDVVYCNSLSAVDNISADTILATVTVSTSAALTVFDYISAGGNITGNQLSTPGMIAGGAAWLSGNITTTGTISANGDISADDITTYGQLSAQQTVFGADGWFANDISCSLKVMGDTLWLCSNASVNGIVSSTGNHIGASGMFEGLSSLGNSYFGGVNNHLAISSNGFMWISGAPLPWDDLRVTALDMTKAGAADPTLGVFPAGQATQAYLFAAAVDDELFFTVQFPHAMAFSGEMDAHVHWSPTTTDTGTVVWGLDITPANVNGTFGATILMSAASAGDGTTNKHQYCELSSFPASVLLGVVPDASWMANCRIFRDANQDTYTGDVALLEVDFHYQKDCMGSDGQILKSWPS